MENRRINYKDIKGWGVDADPENDPTYPIRKRSPDDERGYNWERPAQQRVNIEILHSIERPDLTSVFGTSTPPSGLSGAIRRFAFKYSENSYLHWLPLLLADRINVYEGIFADLKSGHIPNIIAERGWKAEWKYNKKGLAQKAVVAVALAGVVAGLMVLKSKSKRKYINKYNV